MGIISIWKGDYTKASNLLRSYNCDYNYGIAQIMTEDYTVAEKTLRCAPQDAGTYYLMAVLGARSDNTTLMYEYLTKAVQADASLKAEAAMDREFVNYFNEADFQAVVQ